MDLTGRITDIDKQMKALAETRALLQEEVEKRLDRKRDGFVSVPLDIHRLGESYRPAVQGLLASPPYVARSEEPEEYYCRWWRLLLTAALLEEA